METPDVIHVDTREGYDRWSEIYDDEHNPLVMLEEPRVRALLGDVRGQRIADVGCGTGRHTVWLAQGGADVTGLDFSERMLEVARRKLTVDGSPFGQSPVTAGIRFVQHDVTRPLPFPESTFDQVVSCLVLDHIADVAGFFGELGRVCRREGRVTVSVMHPAMMLKGVQARFLDPQTQQRIMPASCAHQLSDYVMGAVRAGLTILHISEHVMDAPTAARSPRAEKYAGWPVLLLMQLAAAPRE